MNMRMAGTLLAALGGGAAALGGKALIDGAVEAGTPEHQRAMTQEDRAKSNWARTADGLTGTALKDAALNEGLRQGVMGGKLSIETVAMMAITGKLPAGTVELMQDWVDIGAHVPRDVLMASTQSSPMPASAISAVLAR